MKPQLLPKIMSLGDSGESWTASLNSVTGDSGWVQIDTADCWYKCGNKGGLCEDGCGSNGYCCKKGLDDCPSEAGEVSPIHHTCVRKTGYSLVLKFCSL